MNEKISKEMFYILYEIIHHVSDSYTVKTSHYNKALERAKEEGLIKKTALEEARDSWHELNISKKYSFDCHTHDKITDIVNYY